MSAGAATAPLVLAYHSVAPGPRPDVEPSMLRTVAELEDDVARLRAEGRRIVPASELPAGGVAAEPLAALTFDDGWADALTVATPALTALGVRGTFFLCPGLLGNEDARMSHAGRVLTAGEARALHAAGMELGAHSLTHPDLTELGDDALRAELEGSRAGVEALSGEPCTTFAYPFGAHDARVRAAAAAAGFRLAFAYAPGPWSAWAVPRTPVP